MPHKVLSTLSAVFVPPSPFFALASPTHPTVPGGQWVHGAVEGYGIINHDVMPLTMFVESQDVDSFGASPMPHASQVARCPEGVS